MSTGAENIAFRRLVNVAILLSLIVIGLGAYTRLTDAGLGCPDWPGCYGKLTAPLHEEHIAIEAKSGHVQFEVGQLTRRGLLTIV